ncbi:MAG: hypothetical protein DMG68_21700 [Acidobacteria bacterium]|nr:MAG: hypothetical protein DMG68_21700 [Acidobacteriota bacterium]
MIRVAGMDFGLRDLAGIPKFDALPELQGYSLRRITTGRLLAAIGGLTLPWLRQLEFNALADSQVVVTDIGPIQVGTVQRRMCDARIFAGPIQFQKQATQLDSIGRTTCWGFMDDVQSWKFLG